MQVVEVTTKNKDKYLSKIANLELVVLDKMDEEGKVGQLFITGYEDIEAYIDSKDNSVFCIVDDLDNVLSVTYITQGQIPFTYNDITKYFKYNENYLKYILINKFSNNLEKFIYYMKETYKIKLEAYNYAKELLLKDSKFSSINYWILDELGKKDNNFHEKSELRENFNIYMYQYIEKNYPDMCIYYKWFYHVDSKLISSYIDIKNTDNTIEYDNILSHLGYKIYESSNFNEELYYDAFPNNSIEIDTYLTSPKSRAGGLSRIIVFEGIKKHIINFFENTNESKLYLCSTLHRDNISSKYVSEFFLLEDNLYLNRRSGRDREVHIFRIDRENYQEYLKMIAAKLAIYYDYNPDNTVYSKEYTEYVKQIEEKYVEKQLTKDNSIEINKRFKRVRER